MMTKSFLVSILTSRVTIGAAVAIGAQVAERYGLKVDQSGLTDDIGSFIGLAIAASGHVKTVKGLTNAKTALNSTGVDPEHAATTGVAVTK